MLGTAEMYDNADGKWTTLSDADPRHAQCGGVGDAVYVMVVRTGRRTRARSR